MYVHFGCCNQENFSRYSTQQFTGFQLWIVLYTLTVCLWCSCIIMQLDNCSNLSKYSKDTTHKLPLRYTPPSHHCYSHHLHSASSLCPIFLSHYQCGLQSQEKWPWGGCVYSSQGRRRRRRGGTPLWGWTGIGVEPGGSCKMGVGGQGVSGWVRWGMVWCGRDRYSMARVEERQKQEEQKGWSVIRKKNWCMRQDTSWRHCRFSDLSN